MYKMTINDKINLICLKRAVAGCSINVLHHNKEIYKKSFGFANIENGKKITPKSIFHIASVTKPITAIAVMKLIEKNPQFSIHTKTFQIIKNNENIFNNFKKHPQLLEKTKEISLFHLLTHKSGIRHYKTNKEFTEQKLLKLNSTNYLDNLSIFGNDSLLFEPGKQYHYSSYGYIFLTIIIEAISKMPYFEYIKQEILIPLQMSNTIVHQNEKTVNQYYRIFKYIDKNYKRSYYSDLKKIPKTNTYIKGGAGMLMSTSSDLVKFGNEAILGNFLDIKLKNEILKGYSNIQKNNWYGLGWHQNKQQNPNRIWHSGGAIGGSAYLEIDIENQLIFSILCNTQVNLYFMYEIIKEIKNSSSLK